MRFFEFAGDDNLDKFTVVIKNLIGRYASKKSPANFNWAALNHLMVSSGVELMADYDVFKAIYDSTPQLQPLIKDFNEKGLELNIPGVKDENELPDDTEDGQAAVDQIASGAAPKQLDQQAKTPQT